MSLALTATKGSCLTCFQPFIVTDWEISKDAQANQQYNLVRMI